MPDSSPSGKKRKITIAACEKGVEIAEKALIRLGFDSKSNFAESQRLSRSVVTKFFNQKRIQLDSFKRICEALKLKWQEIAGITEESLNLEPPLEKQVNPNPDIEEGVQPVKTLVRQVTVVDSSNNKIKTVIKLQGDINSPANLKIIAAVLKEYGGHTVEIIDIKEGSIKLIIEGSQEDIERLLSQIKSGELTEIDGFPVEVAQILSESAEDEESSKQKWRLVEQIVTNPIKGRDLSGADLSDADLRNTRLINANLSNADLSDSDLSGVKLSDADLSGAKLIGADLINAKLSGANLIGANLIGAYLIGADLSGAYLIGADLSGAKLNGANLIGAKLSDADLSGAKLSGANLIGANLSGANLIGANLIGADLSRADLSRANLSDANLSDAYLSDAYLSRADLTFANLSRADLNLANLSNAKVNNARFSGSLGISEAMKQDLIKRGAIFEDSPGDRSKVLV
jgi:uncharacterized protein YjbI with pentapeptide repeats/DNA-binding Xre family transcriptional regulator